MEIKNNILGEKVKKYRHEKKFTLQKLSEKSELSIGFLSKIERGICNPSINNIQKICNALDVTTNELTIDKEGNEKISSVNHGKSYVLHKEERSVIYGFTNAFCFESIYEDNPNFKVNVLTLSGGISEKTHAVHNFDELGMVAKGKLAVELDDGSHYELSEGECIMIRAKTLHFISSLSSEECVSFWIEITNSDNQ